MNCLEMKLARVFEGVARDGAKNLVAFSFCAQLLGEGR